MISSGQFRVLERSQLDRALSEQKLQNSGLVDNNNMAALGKMLGAHFIIIGSVVKLGTAYTINARMIDVKTGEATLGNSAKGHDPGLLPELSHALLESLFGPHVSSKASLIFEERFTDRTHNWYLANDRDKRFEIVNGQYIIESKRGGSWISMRSIPLNQSADFKIEMTVQKMAGTDDYGFGMSWGAEGLDRYYIFVITGNGYFIHERREGSKAQRILSKYTTAIKKGSGSSNDLQLRKTGNNLEFYINGKFVGKTLFAPFFGDDIGCVIYSGNRAITVGFTDLFVYGH